MRRSLYVTLLVATLVVVIVCIIPTSRIILVGWLRGELTYRGKPTSYWVLALSDRDESSLADLRHGGAASVPVLIEALADQDAQVRLNAANVLGEIGAEAVPLLIVALSDLRAIVRIGAARALHRIGAGATHAIPALTNALNDGDPLVVSMCIAALGRTGKPAVPILIETFQDRENRGVKIRLASLEALSTIGPDAIEASAIILKAAKEEDDPIAERAGETLKKIDPDTAAKNGIE
jgi:HEAT repeat protein